MHPNTLNHDNFQNISILELEDNKKVLILICDNLNNANDLHEVLKTNTYSIEVRFNKSKEVCLRITFDVKYQIILETNRTVENYPPSLWLGRAQVTLLTTGCRGNDDTLQWIQNYLPLSRPSLN